MYKEDRTETVQVRLSKLEKTMLETIANETNRTPALALRQIFLDELKKLEDRVNNTLEKP